MLNCDWLVTLWLYHFRYIWFLEGQNFRFCGSLGYCSQKGRRPDQDPYVPLCKFSCRPARDICPRAKIHIFLDSPGGYRPMLYILESCRRADFSSNWHVTLRLTVLEIFGFRGPKFWILGFPWGYRPQKKRKHSRDRYVPSCKISRRSASKKLGVKVNI